MILINIVVFLSLAYYSSAIPSVGDISTIAGTGGSSGYSGDNGPATSATFGSPKDVAVDSSGNFYIVDTTNQVIRKVASNGIITTVAGSGTGGFSGDNGPATSAQLYYPIGVAVDSLGNLFIADNANNLIRKVDVNGVITTVAGTPGSSGYSGDNGPATSAQINQPAGGSFDTSGNFFFADSVNQVIRKVDVNGVITTVAGTGSNGNSGDNGPATSAKLSSPNDVAVDSSGNLYISDYGNSLIRKVDVNGVITTVAGTGSQGYSGDNGPATSAKIKLPVGVAVDTSGNLYIADNSNSIIRKVDVTGIITTFAGTPGSSGFSGDNGPATSAKISAPTGVAIDSSGNLYIADSNNKVIRFVSGGTSAPTAEPTAAPTESPTFAPSFSMSPTFAPTASPTKSPTSAQASTTKNDLDKTRNFAVGFGLGFSLLATGYIYLNYVRKSSEVISINSPDSKEIVFTKVESGESNTV